MLYSGSVESFQIYLIYFKHISPRSVGAHSIDSICILTYGQRFKFIIASQDQITPKGLTKVMAT